MLSPTGSLKIRSDYWGAGVFGAGRKNRAGKSYRHEGLDLECTPTQGLICPLSCCFIRIAWPGQVDGDYGGILLQDGNLEIKIFYFEPFEFDPGQGIDRGQSLGIAQDISKRYDSRMTPHIHIETRIDGKLMDPMIFL